MSTSTRNNHPRRQRPQRPVPRPPSALDRPSILDRPSALDYSPAVDKPRGGARPGAGAPSANLNAYKHGRYSRQKRQLVRLLVVLEGNLPPQLLPLLQRLLSDAELGQHVRALGLQVQDLKTRLQLLTEQAVTQEEFASDPPAA